MTARGGDESHHDDRIDVCEQCGAVAESGESCRDRFSELLAFDHSDPAYGRVHLLVVATYSAQHAEGFTDAAVQAYDAALVRHARMADEDPLGDALRRWLSVDARTTFSGPERVRGASPTARRRPRWSRTVFDVRFEDGQAYRRSVSGWAASAGRDLSSGETAGGTDLT